MSDSFNWLGKPTLESAITAAITRADVHNFALLQDIADASAIPNGCDLRFIEISKFLVDGTSPDMECHPDFEGTWRFFQRLAKKICDNHSLADLSKKDKLEQLNRMARIAGWRNSLAEIWKLKPYRDAQRSGDDSDKILEYVTGNEAMSVWLQDPQTAAFLSKGIKPEQIPNSFENGGSYAHQVVISGLCSLIHRQLLTVTCDFEQFILSLCDWIGNCDDWGNFNMHGSLNWVTSHFGLGGEFEEAKKQSRLQAAYAWPEVARTLGQQCVFPKMDWPERTKSKWVEGVVAGCVSALKKDVKFCADIYSSQNTEAVEKRGAWQKYAYRPKSQPSATNPFETENCHPFASYMDLVAEPPIPSFTECFHYVQSMSEA